MRKPRPINPGRHIYDAMTYNRDSGEIEPYKLEPLSDKTGFDGYLVPWYVLSDRGTFFRPGSLKRSAGQQLKYAPHLYQHDTWEPIGKHEKAFEDDTGFRISVAINEETNRGREVMSNLEMGVPLGLSIGVDILEWESATDEDEAKLDRRSAPKWLKDVPTNELMAIKQAKWWESSTVTFAGIATAKPDVIHNGEQTLARILEAIDAGNLTEYQMRAIRDIVKSAEASPALAATERHRTDDDARSHAIRAHLAAIAAQNARLIVEGLTV